MPQIGAARLYPVVFLFILLVVFGGLSYVVLRPFFDGILWAAVVAVALWSLWERVRARVGKRQALAAGFFTLGVALVVLLFRVFDVVKPFPAGRAEHLPGGWGIMTDDVVAGIYSLVGLSLVGLILK